MERYTGKKKMEEDSVKRIKALGFSDLTADVIYNHCTVMTAVIQETPFIQEIVHPIDPCYTYKLNIIVFEEITIRLKELLERKQTIEKQKQEN